MKVAALIYTHDRTTDAKINMELIRNHWSEKELFQDVVIIHCFNGERKRWPEKYLEDHLIYCENKDHFSGASILIDSGIEEIFLKNLALDYLITLASDTWLLNPDYIEKVLLQMANQNKYLAGCGWSQPVTQSRIWKDISSDFFVLDLNWAKASSMFPLRYVEYLHSYGEVFLLMNKLVYLEDILLLRFKQAINHYYQIKSPNEFHTFFHNYILLIYQREPVNVYYPSFLRNMHFPSMGLLTHHDPYKKREDLALYQNISLGFEGLKLMQSEDLSYYNFS